MDLSHDADLREPLFDFLDESWAAVFLDEHPQADSQTAMRTRILEEVPIGDSRADAVLVTEQELCGIEIKSDADSYACLKTQIPDYDRFFDRNLLVVGSRHALHAAEHVPEWWGILSAELEEDGRWDFYTVRPCRRNPAGQTPEGQAGAGQKAGTPAAESPATQALLEYKLSLLWRKELAHILEDLDMPKYAGKSRAFVARKLAKMCGGDSPSMLNLDHMVSEALLQRDYTKVPAPKSSRRKSLSRRAHRKGRHSEPAAWNL